MNVNAVILHPDSTVSIFSHLSLPYVDAEGLIQIKSGSHREKDLLDISALKDS